MKEYETSRKQQHLRAIYCKCSLSQARAITSMAHWVVVCKTRTISQHRPLVLETYINIVTKEKILVCSRKKIRKKSIDMLMKYISGLIYSEDITCHQTPEPKN